MSDQPSELRQWQQTSVCIYALRDPQTQRVRYVGQSIAPPGRLSAHLAASSLKTNTAKNRWLRDLAERGLTPELCIVEIGPIEEGAALERRWISIFLAQGEPLLNVVHCSRANGDPARPTGRPPKPEEERYLYKPIRFPPDLWAELEAMAPPKGRSAIVQEGLRRELARLKRLEQRQQGA